MKKITLFCIPYAGGSALNYLKWDKYLDDKIELVPVELAGRGSRMDETPYLDIEEAVEDVLSFIKSKIDPGKKYAIFGHSMGSLIAFEVYYRLHQAGLSVPFHMFFSGRDAPHCPFENNEYYLLPDKDFLQVVMRYGGNTEQMVKTPELLKIFMPILRADFRIVETYKYIPKADKIACKCTVLSGSEDRSVTANDVKEWGIHFEGESNFAVIDGGHFFILDNYMKVVEIINHEFQDE